MTSSSIDAPIAAGKAEFIALLRASGVLAAPTLDRAIGLLGPTIRTAAEAARVLVLGAILTPFQAERLVAGKIDGLVLGQYILLEPLRKGTAGGWFKVRHRTMNRLAAVEILAADATSDPTRRNRFLKEAREAARLAHPNVLTILDCNEIDQRLYLVTEYLDGFTLDATLARMRWMEPAAATALLGQIARGLHHAHERGIVHGSLNPACILLGRPPAGKPDRFEVKVADFGIFGRNHSKAERGADKAADYRAPEQSSPRDASPAADLYSLGCLAYRMLTGFLPYEVYDPDAKAAAHRLDPVPAPERVRPGLDASLAGLVKSLMAKDPAHRPESAEQAAKRFELCCEEAEPGGFIDFNVLQRNPASSTISQPSGLLTGLNTPAEVVAEPSPWSSLTRSSDLTTLKLKQLELQDKSWSSAVAPLALIASVLLGTLTAVVLALRFLVK